MHNLKYLALAFLLATLAITPALAKPGRCGKTFENGEQQATRLEHLKESLDLTAQQEREIKEILAASQEGNARPARSYGKLPEPTPLTSHVYGNWFISSLTSGPT